MKLSNSVPLFLLMLTLVNLHYIYGEFFHCEFGKCLKYYHIIVGSKIDRCTEEILIKYKPNDSYIKAFLNQDGFIIDKSFLRNCTAETEIKVYKNFVAYRKDNTILVAAELSTFPNVTNVDLFPFSTNKQQGTIQAAGGITTITEGHEQSQTNVEIDHHSQNQLRGTI